jgi:sporulation protein YlmC with PRC-barrel domain
MRTRHDKSLRILGIVALAVGAGTLAANAQDIRTTNRPSDPQAGGTVAAALMDRDARVSDLIGQRVSSARGEDLGEIEDLVATPGVDKPPTVVLSIGGVADVGDKWYATSFDELRVSPDGDGLVLDASRDQLAAAPAYQYQPRAGERSGQPGVVGPGTANSIGGLVGATVVDETGDTLGEIEDLVVSTRSEGTRAVVASGGLVGIGERLVAVPLDELHIDRSGEEAAGVPLQAKVRIDDTVLASLPKYEYPDNFPN